MPALIRVFAVEGRMVPALGADGRPVLRRYVARDADGLPVASGASVPADSYHTRALARGDLTTEGASE